MLLLTGILTGQCVGLTDSATISPGSSAKAVGEDATRTGRYCTYDLRAHVLAKLAHGEDQFYAPAITCAPSNPTDIKRKVTSEAETPPPQVRDGKKDPGPASQLARLAGNFIAIS